MENAKIIRCNGGPAIECDGVLYPPMTATLFRHDAAYYKGLRESGIRIFLCGLRRTGYFPMP